MKTRYYQLFNSNEIGVYHTKESKTLIQPEFLIGIKGKIPRIGDEVKIKDSQGLTFVKVTQLSQEGIPVSGTVIYTNDSNIDQGQVIEFVGRVIQLLNLLGLLVKQLKEWFSKKSGLSIGLLMKTSQ